MSAVTRSKEGERGAADREPRLLGARRFTVQGRSARQLPLLQDADRRTKGPVQLRQMAEVTEHEDFD